MFLSIGPETKKNLIFLIISETQAVLALNRELKSVTMADETFALPK